MKILFTLLHLSFLCFAINAQAPKSVGVEKAKEAKKTGLSYFKGTFQEALEKAKKEDKMIFIDSYTTWCGPCKVMKNVYLEDVDLYTYLNKHFICMSVDAEKKTGRYIRRKYPHGTFPSLLFIKNNGRLKNKFIGLPDHGAKELLNFAKLTVNT